MPTEERALAIGSEERFLNPYIAAGRRYVDDVIAAAAPARARRPRSSAFENRERQPRRRRSDTPL